MVVKVIRAEYDGLREAAKVFAHHADLSVALTFQIEGLVGQLQGGAWRGVGADGFYAEMGEVILPAMRKLEDALQFARDSTLTIIEIMQAAEAEAAALFRGLPGGDVTRPHQDDDERRKQVLKEVLDLLAALAGIASDDEFGDHRSSEAAAATAINLLSERFPDLSRMDSLTLAELMSLLEDLRQQAELLSLLHSAYVLSGRQGSFPGWVWAGLPFEQLQALLDRSQAHLTNSPWGDWLKKAFDTPLWMLLGGKFDPKDWRYLFALAKDTIRLQFLEQFNPAEQIAFLIGLQQMIRENGEYGGFTVGEVPRSGILPVMNALAHLKYYLDQVEAKAQADLTFGTELGLQKGASELDAGDLDPLVGGIFGLSKFGRDEHFSQDEGGGGSKDDDTGKGAERVIKPSLSPDPNRKPKGDEAQVSNKAEKTNADDIKLENESGEALARAGYDVKRGLTPAEIPPHIAQKKKPDYLVEGVPMDCYAPHDGTSNMNIWRTIKSKVERRQADGVVLNMDNLSKEKADDLITYLQAGDIDIKDIRTIIGVRGGEVIVIYPKP